MTSKSLFLIFGIIAIQFTSLSFLMELSAITATVRGSLPTSINEASSLAYAGEAGFWSNNDGGGSNKIYRISNTGSLKQSITILEATNRDWEDITHDADRSNMFIGDFGNNNSSRQNLKIYKIPYPTSASGNTITASVINFSYPDQTKFPATWNNFDVEAFFYLKGKLYLFTKGVGNTAKYTKMYMLPDDPGTYVATLVDSFYVNGRITSAAISPDKKSAVLISNTQIHLFRNFIQNNIFTGQYFKISISGSWTQKEGVSFFSNSMIYISDEGAPGRNHLYSVDLSSYIITPRLSTQMNNEEVFSSNKIIAYPNPANSFTIIENNELFRHVEILILNLKGQVVKHFEIENPDQNIRLETDLIPVGVYSVQMIGDYRKKMNVLISVIR